MNNIVKSAISTAAGKIFKLKTSQKIAIGAAAAVTAAATGLVIAKSVQAKKQDRSVKSLVLEDATRALPVSVKREPSFEESMEKSSKPFVLPQRNPRKFYHDIMQSYNAPDFTKARVRFDTRGVYREVFSDKRVQATVKP